MLLSGAAFAGPGGPPTLSIPTPDPIGPSADVTVRAPSSDTNNRLIVDVWTRPLVVNAYISSKRIAVSEAVRTLPGLPEPHTRTYKFKQAIDLPPTQ